MTERESNPAVAEQGRVPEYLGREDIGLQARLLIGNFTDKTLAINRSMFQSIHEHGAQGIERKVAKGYQKASFTERLHYQEQTGLTYQRWKSGFNKYLQRIRNDTVHEERKEFLETLGITESVSAEDFYNEYLRGKSDVIKFIDTVETLATRDQIREHEDIIRAIGNTFGFGSSEVIDHLIHGVSNVKYNLDGFVKRAKKSVNNQGIFVNPLFEKILEDSGEEEQPKVAKMKEPEQPEVPEEVLPSREERVPAPEQEEHILEVEPEQEEKSQQFLEEGSEPEEVSTPETKVPVEEPVEEQREGSILSQMGELPVWEEEEEIQLFPAPILERKRDDSPLTPEEIKLAVTYLYFNDVNPQDEVVQAQTIKSSEAMKYYVRELKYMMEEYGHDFVLTKAGDAILFLQQDLTDIGLKRDKHSKSHSWYLWHIAKSRFLANNPDVQQTMENADQYRSFDPILHYAVGIRSDDGKKSLQAEEDIMHAMLGWEVYRQRTKIRDILFHLDPVADPREKRRLQELLNEKPRDEEPHTLSAFKLREIGELIKKNKKRS